MTATIFGGTGRTGRHLVQRALESGHRLTLLVRDASKAPEPQDGLRVVVGTFDEPEKVAGVIAGADAVISAIGPTVNRPPYLATAATRAILSGMEEAGVLRLIVTAGFGLDDPEDRPRFADHVVKAALQTFARHIYNDMSGVVQHVRDSRLEWTVVRAPRLTDTPRSGLIRVGNVGRGVGTQLSREDFADCVLKQLTSRLFVRRSPAISN